MGEGSDPRSDFQKYIDEYQQRDDAWLLENCRRVTGKRRMAMYTILVGRGYTAEDLEQRGSEFDNA